MSLKKQAAKKKRKKEKKKEEKRKERKTKKENTKKNKERRENVCVYCFLFFTRHIYFLVSLIILLYCKYRCIRESGREAGPPDQVVVPAGVPEWVTTPRLLCMYYYFSSMFTLCRETAQRYFPGPQLAGSTETVELGVV